MEYARELYSEEHKRKFTTEKTGFQVVKEPTNGTRLVLAINRKAYCRVVQRANSISYGRAYTDLYSRKGKVYLTTIDKNLQYMGEQPLKKLQLPARSVATIVVEDN